MSAQGSSVLFEFPDVPHTSTLYTLVPRKRNPNMIFFLPKNVPEKQIPSVLPAVAPMWNAARFLGLFTYPSNSS